MRPTVRGVPPVPSATSGTSQRGMVKLPAGTLPRLRKPGGPYHGRDPYRTTSARCTDYPHAG